MSDHRIEILHGEDWAVMFVDEILATENHSIHPADLSPYCPISSIRCSQMPGHVDQWMTDHGNAPEDITLEDFLKLGT